MDETAKLIALFGLAASLRALFTGETIRIGVMYDDPRTGARRMARGSSACGANPR